MPDKSDGHCWDFTPHCFCFDVPLPKCHCSFHLDHLHHYLDVCVAHVTSFTRLRDLSIFTDLRG